MRSGRRKSEFDLKVDLITIALKKIGYNLVNSLFGMTNKLVRLLKRITNPRRTIKNLLGHVATKKIQQVVPLLIDQRRLRWRLGCSKRSAET